MNQLLQIWESNGVLYIQEELRMELEGNGSVLPKTAADKMQHAKMF